MLNVFRKLLCGVLSLQLTLLGMPAHADNSTTTQCPDGGLATIVGCAVAQVGNSTVGYPVLQWATAASTNYTPIVATDTTNYVEALQSASTVRGGFEAQLLQVSSKEAVALATLLPTNTPWVVGRYTAETSELRIDIYRVERNGTTVSVSVAPFTPKHGDIWRASGAYITASERAQGAAGRNPFDAFYSSSDGNFHNISFGAARVALGHAVRYAQAPMGVLGFVYTDLKSQTTKSGGIFRKKFTTEYTGRAMTRWFIGYPTDFGATTSAMAEEPYCVGNVSSTNCYPYQTARSSLAFEEWSGGTLNDGSPVDSFGNKTGVAGEPVYSATEVKKSWTFLAIIVVSFVFSFGAGAIGSFAGGLAGGMSASGAIDMALAGLSSTASAAGFGTGMSVASGLINGADLGTPVSVNPWTGNVSTKSGLSSPSSIDWNGHYGKAVTATRGKALSAAVDAGNSLQSMRKTLVGDCTLAAGASECADSGVIVRKDQLAPTNLLRVWRESDRPTRAFSGLPDVYGDPNGAQ